MENSVAAIFLPFNNSIVMKPSIIGLNGDMNIGCIIPKEL